MNKISLTFLLIMFLIFVFAISCKSETAPSEKTKEEKIAEIIEGMKKNPEWMQALQQKSIDWGKPLDSVMYIDAVWMIEQKKKKQ